MFLTHFNQQALKNNTLSVYLHYLSNKHTNVILPNLFMAPPNVLGTPAEVLGGGTNGVVVTPIYLGESINAFGESHNLLGEIINALW